MNLALIIAQINVSWSDGLIIYGPLGTGWIGMAYFINKLMALHKVREDAMTLRETEREAMHRDSIDKLTGAFHANAHKLNGVQKYLLFLATTHGDEKLSALAKSELARMEAKEE